MMDNGNTVTWTCDERGVGTLTLNRPDKHNAMNAGMIRELKNAISRIEDDQSIRVVVLTGAGESFCAGADLGWMKDQAAATRAERMTEATTLASMLAAFDCLSKPTIAKVQGAAYGGGIGLISVCDIAIAADTARLALTETKLGLIPATISPYVFARLGEAAMRRIALNGFILQGQEAVASGLLSATCSASQLNDQVAMQIDLFLKCAPGAVAETKALIRHLANSDRDSQMETTIGMLADRWETPEAAEGIDAFFARRKPDWTPPGRS